MQPLIQHLPSRPSWDCQQCLRIGLRMPWPTCSGAREALGRLPWSVARDFLHHSMHEAASELGVSPRDPMLWERFFGPAESRATAPRLDRPPAPRHATDNRRDPRATQRQGWRG